MDGKKCENTHVATNMHKAIALIEQVPFHTNSFAYVDRMYQLLKREMDTNNAFLQNFECFYTKQLFEDVIKKTTMYHETTIPFTNILPNDILFIQCSSLFGPYHFIVAVVDNAKKKLYVYQSYGGYKQLHRRMLTYENFIALMERLDRFKQTKDFMDAYTLMLPVETKLYGIDVASYLKGLADQEPKSDSEDDLDEDDEELRVIKENARKLHMTPYVYETLVQQYEQPDDKGSTITAFRLNEPIPPRRTTTMRKRRKYISAKIKRPALFASKIASATSSKV